MKTAETTLNEGKWIETRQSGEQVVSRENALDFAKAYGREIAKAVLKEAAEKYKAIKHDASSGDQNFYIVEVADADKALAEINIEDFIK